MKRQGALVLVAALAASAGCGDRDPCVAYCDAELRAGCIGRDRPACEEQCGIGRDTSGDWGCEDEFEEVTACAAEQSWTCDEAGTRARRERCRDVDEALDDCLGLEGG